MIKISKYLYINPLTLIFFIVCLFFGRKEIFLLSYFSMIFHEIGHTISALLIGLKPSHISLHPFGVNLKLKSTTVFGISDLIILYMSGPFINLIIALVSLGISKLYNLSNYIYILNIMLFFVNILPIKPLDGGVLLEKILCFYFSEHTAIKIINVFTIILATLIMVFGAVAAYLTKYNFSIIFLSVLLFANIITSKEKFPEALLHSVIYSEKKLQKFDVIQTNMMVCNGSDNVYKCINKFKPTKYNIVAILKNKRIDVIKTETEIINELTNRN